LKSTVVPASWVELEPGVYDATFQGREGPKLGEFGDFIVWNFNILTEGEPEPMSGVSSTKFVASRRCKGFRWAQAIDPTLTDEVVTWDDEEFVGAKVLVVLEYQNPDDPGFLKVKDVQPCRTPRSEPK